LLTTTEEVVTESAPEAGQEQSAGTEAVIAAANAEGPADSAIEQTQAGDDGALTETPGANGARLVSLVSTGEDVLRISFRGASWIEIDDGSMVRLYNDMMGAGDALTIRGEAPFHVLIGDATQVDVNLNAALVDISDDIREDSSARLVLEAAAMAGTETETAGVTP
jgi:cytoskeleton protein RodZ